MLPSSPVRSARRVINANPAVASVVIITILALASRLVFLGDRIAHYDEGRVAYWALNYLDTGSISYRYIVHGPFIQYVDAFLFGLFGPSDAISRVPVALVGGLLPLAALLFREHLRSTEVVALATFLAFNPVLLYYSRFLRSTLLVAAFLFVAFGLLVRGFDTHRVRYLYAASTFVAIGFAAKENAIIYLVVWIGATILLADHVLFRPHTDDSGYAVASQYWFRGRELVRSAGRRRLARYGCHAVGIVFTFLLVALFFFAPRSGGEGIGLWYALSHPSSVPELLDVTYTDVSAGFEYWFSGSSEPGCHKDNLIDAYGCFLGRFIQTLVVAAAPLTLLAVCGFLVERYNVSRPRFLVMFASYWGFVSVLGYPLGTDIYGAWITVNALVPLAIPAAVGLAYIYRQGRAAVTADDYAVAGLLAVAIVLLVGQVGATAMTTVYLAPQSADNNLVQYAQPTDDFRPTLERVQSVSDDGDVSVVIYGDELVHSEKKSSIPPYCARLANGLPIQWYLAKDDVDVTCAIDREALEKSFDGGRPSLIIARGSNVSELRRQLDGHKARTFDLRAPGEETVFLVEANQTA